MVRKIEVSPTAYISQTVAMLNRCGLLLVSGEMGRANVMTIGWGLLGHLWMGPFFIVPVRPSRYTHKFIEETGDFTVNVPKIGMEEIADYCGTVSGREHDKFREKGLTLMPGRCVKSPIIAECIIHYECKVAYKTKVISKRLPGNIISACYPHGNYHTLYFGEILSTYADEDAEEKLFAKPL